MSVGKNKNVIHRPWSIRIGRNCAPGEFVILKPFFSAIEAVRKNYLKHVYQAFISRYYFGFKGLIVVENQANKLY